MIKLLKSKKALSPVVAAIILIAVTVAVSIAVAAWMGSMTFTFMETEEIVITNLEFEAGVANGTITVNARNTGTTDVIIISASVNGEAADMVETDYTIGKGASTPNIELDGLDFDAGTAYNVQLLSSKGNKFSYTGTATVDSIAP
jgi:flagellin-like protein